MKWISPTLAVGVTVFIPQVAALFQPACVSWTSGSFALVKGGKAAPILIGSDDWPGVQRAAADFQSDVHKVSGIYPTLSNYTTSSVHHRSHEEARGKYHNFGRHHPDYVEVHKRAGPPSHYPIPPPPRKSSWHWPYPPPPTQWSGSSTPPVIVGTWNHSSLISQVITHANLDVSSLQGKWESFWAGEVKNPLPNIASAYVIIGSDKRGTIFGLYELSEQIGVSPWYWWADVPSKSHSTIYLGPCTHGTPSVKYRGIFLNDEQPALQLWAQDTYTNGTTPPFNHYFYENLFELILRLHGNFFWPAQWGAMFGVDDPLNQYIADYYGCVYGTSHEEPMARSIPNEWNYFHPGQNWDFNTNAANITEFWTEGVQRAAPYETLYTVGMRGNGDTALSGGQNIALLENVITTQRQIFQNVLQVADPATVPQSWCLYKEVYGYYLSGMRVPDDITLLWTDDNWGNIRRLPIASERNRTGGAGVYYHYDYVGTPRDYKWITTTQIARVYEQMSMANQRGANTIWILNVGDLKPYEMSTEFFIALGYDAEKYNQNNLDAWVAAWATREFGTDAAKSSLIAQVVANVTKFNARRKPEMLNSTSYSLLNYREADAVQAEWQATYDASLSLYNSMSSAYKPAFFELVHHAVAAGYTLGMMYFSAGKNNLYASQSRLSANQYADATEAYFAQDYDLENQYNTMLESKWTHMMDQTHMGYAYWQQPNQNMMPAVNRVPPKKQALAGPMRILVEGSQGAWPGDNMFDCAQQYSCPPPTIRAIDAFLPAGSRYVDVSAGGPDSFTWTAISNVSWLTAVPSSGSISASNPEKRVELKVKWSGIPAGQTGYGQVTFTANPSNPDQPELSPATQEVVPVYVPAVHTTVPSGWHGYVEGDGAVSIEAAHFTTNHSVNGVSWVDFPGLGRTVSALELLPAVGPSLGDTNFTLGSGPSVTYNFYTFNTLGGNNVTATLHLLTNMNVNGDDRPLGYGIQVDSGATQLVIPVAQSGANGAVPPGFDAYPDGPEADYVIYSTTAFSNVAPGAHTLTVWGVDFGVGFTKVVINTGGVRAAYLGPPESIKV